jgi:hypothetical protein
MRNSRSADASGAADSAAPQDLGFSPWQRLKSKRISYLTLPLLFMATVTEFVILATGWKYQQTVCLPQGMGVTFFGIGPIGATILAVELLKLPLAIWTASRAGWQKGLMITVGLPLICILTFQLVKDMAVYEMGVAMSPAAQMLEKAEAEEVKIAQLKADLAAIEGKKTERERKLADLAAKQGKAKAELEDSLKRNESTRQDAISLTDYQKKELSEVEARQANIIKQFASDTEQLTKSIADLRARREAEFARSSKDSVDWEKRKAAYDAAFAKWHTEEARIDNAFQTAMSDYANRKAAFQKDKAEYAAASFLHRQLMKEPIDPGVPPVREADKVPKPSELDGRPSALIAEIDEQIKAKEAELLAVNNKRRDRIAQVDADARALREEFDHRSVTKREESDRKRDELTAGLATLAKEEKAERDQIDQEYDSVVKKVDGIRAEVDASRKKAEGFYEAREASIRKTQVHRIATTVEIVRGLLKGERPMSIKVSAKERGDILTDQISMVRIFVYPVLAFIVAFLPTLMVEIGFSTVFHDEKERPAYRMGFLGRRLHWLYTRAGRQKILRAERIADQASSEIAARDTALAEATAAADRALFDKDTELQTAREALVTSAAKHREQLKQLQDELAEETKKKEEEWVSKLAGMADSLNRTVIEKDALKDLQKSEIERQIQLRQNAWSDRVTQLRQELDEQRAASETERTTLMQEHHKKLLEVSEDCKTQVIQARRQAADAEIAAMEASARLSHELKEALHARDTVESHQQQQAETFAIKMAQAKDEAARELEKATRQEKHRLERQQLEFGKALRQRDDDHQHQLKQREQELSLAFDARLGEEQTKFEQNTRKRGAELERQFEARALEVETRWKQELQQREESAQTRLKQRELQLQAQADARLAETQTQAEQELRRRESEWQRQIDALSREADGRLKQESQQKELVFQAKLKQREQELSLDAQARETELQKQFASDLRVREEELERQAESRIRATETRLAQEAQQREELFQAKSRQRDQQWQVKLDALRGESQAQSEALRRRDADVETTRRELEAGLRKEIQQHDEAAQARAEQREQELIAELSAQAEARFIAARAQWEAESENKARAAVEPLKVLLARTEKERDDARQSAFETSRQVQSLEKKLTEASTFLNGWRNGGGKTVVAA